MDELRHAAAERNARLAAVRERERRRRGDSTAFRMKRARPAATNTTGKEARDDDFLPEDADAVPDDGMNLSAEVRALMAQLDKPSSAKEVEEEDVPKVRPG
jgi:chromosome transmission fidelity protein 1